MEEILKDLGLNDNEIKIYITLLNNGPQQTNMISRKSNIHRRNVYDSLDRLIEKGYVAYIKENNVKIYSATNPKHILEKLELKKKSFEEMLPELLFKFNRENEKKETLFYRGKEGLKQIFEDQIKIGEEILIYATSYNVQETMKYFFLKYDRERKEKNIPVRMIFDENIKKDKDILQKLKEIPNRKIHFIKEFNKSPMSQYIYGNNVAIILWGDEPISILIRQKDIAQGFRSNFELLFST